MRSGRTVILLLVTAIQFWVGVYRGQALPIGGIGAPSCAGVARSLALHEHEDTKAHGSHSHDELPLHLHVPEEESSSRAGRRLAAPVVLDALPAAQNWPSIRPSEGASPPATRGDAREGSSPGSLAMHALRAIRLLI